MRLSCCCSTLLLLLLTPRSCDGGNILVVPTEGSHWINMDILLQALHSRGHNITILRSSKSWYIKDKASYYNTYTVPMERSIDQKFISKLLSEVIRFERGALPLTSFLHSAVEMFEAFSEAHTIIGEFVSAILEDRELMRTLNESRFDLLLTDPCWGGGVILAKYLNLPLVYNVRWVMAEEAHLVIAPSPISYIPITGSGNTDKMTFFQRVKNMILYLLIHIENNVVVKQVYQTICDKYLGPDSDYNQLKIDADIWLMRVDFVFDYPRPTMPNVVYMGGFQCKPAKPLPEHLEEFVQSSGEHGVIIMSLGTFVNELPDDMADEIAATFAKLPQKVIWRYKGKRPASLGDNTLVVDWMPQNDLLGHPKIKLFVGHGGTNGVQEAMYHGVPVVGLPVCFDQYDNLLRLQERGAAKILTLAAVDKDDNFLKAIQEVISDPSYRVNMQRLSRLHRDQPMKPLDTALFWIEFVMRHKGAAHLKAQSYTMSWFSYYSVDVVLFLTGAVLLMFLSFFIVIRCLCNVMCKQKVKRDMRLSCCCSTLLLLLLTPRSCDGGNILVVPTEGSHWINMDILLQALHSRGHNITILRSSKSWYIKDKASYNTYTVPVERSIDQMFVTKIMSDYIQFERGAIPLTSFLHSTVGIFAVFSEAHTIIGEFVSAILEDRELMRTLNESRFDLLLTDPCWGGGVILAKYLNLPLVYNVRWVTAEEAHLVIAPSPISYIPITGSGNTDKMTFFQRVKNMILYLLIHIENNVVVKQVYQTICDKYLGPDSDYNQLKIDADIWLMRVDFVFDYPRPTMPNVVYMGGFQCKPSKPLPEHLEEFVQSSGEHRVIIMSLGTFVNELPDDMADEIAATFNKLPQKVIWRYKGKRPASLGNNTLVVDWMPQNDLLGHPKIKLFVAHGGTNGVQEAMYHGVPVVGLPVCFDQYDNLLRLQERGAAKILTLAAVDKDDNFLKAIQEVISDPSYRVNVQRLSRLHRDQPMKPLDTALFWIEFVMRHKGAAHLKAQSYTMSWFSYYSVDVVLFLTGAVLLMFLSFFIFIRCLCNVMCKQKVKRD
ncbi:LOW QUALITY PROTEIN: uncharacterized protein FYW49_013654 [Xenentodon cancila]